MIERSDLLIKIQEAFEVNRIVCLLGPRASGKTTIAKEFWAKEHGSKTKRGYFDLENPIDLELLSNPNLALEELEGLIIIDEIQRRPNLFPCLRYLHDENPNQRYLILGSASRELINQSSESLAGRISYIEITPFNIKEADDRAKLWVKGGFPKSYLLKDKDSIKWRAEYVRTYLEQDLGTLGLGFNPDILRRMWFMLANCHGQILGASELAKSLGITSPTISRYVGMLEASFMVRILNPWFENIKKRQVKSPKIYFRDTGILHYFLGIPDYDLLSKHPKIGASWEGFALEQICNIMEADKNEAFFWASHNKAELDLMLLKSGKKVGYEFKYSDAPKLTKSMKIAMEDLDLSEINVVYPGSKEYSLAENIKVLPLRYFSNKSP